MTTPMPLTTVRLTSRWLTVELLTFGASIRSVAARDRDGRTGPVHLRLPTLDAYLDPARNPHLGATAGRYANRIAGARFPLDGRMVDLDANEGPNQLHGGPVGFGRRAWALVDHRVHGGGGSATMRLTSVDGDQGYPGRLEAEVTYEVAGDVLRITYRATTEAPTVVNLTNHGYWNLAGGGPVDDHLLTVAADRYLPVDDAGIPTGGPAPVDGSPFDLRAARPLGRVIAAIPGGLDHSYEVAGRVGARGVDVGPTGSGLRFAARLDHPPSGRWLTVHTDQPAVQAYTGNHLGEPFVRHGAVCLETQRFPDTPNRPDLGSAVLRPDATYVSTTELRFGAT